MNNKMLSKSAVRMAYEKGLETRLSIRLHPQGNRGLYDPQTKRIFVYLSAISSWYDFYITLLHEFIHARDDLIRSISDFKSTEARVDQEARKTYQKRPKTLELIIELYNLRKRRNWSAINKKNCLIYTYLHPKKGAARKQHKHLV